METYFHFPKEEDGTPGKVLQDVRVLLGDVEGLMREARGRLGARSRQELDTALEKMETARQKLKVQARRTAVSTDRLVKRHPYQSVGFAFSFGLLLGLLSTRR